MNGSQTISAAAYRDAIKPKGQKRASGKNSQRTSAGFDSRAEERRYGDLLWLQSQGIILDLKRQIPIVLRGRDGPLLTKSGREMTYVADFTYIEDGIEIVEDCKGYPSDIYLLKRSILAAQGVIIRETRV